MKCLLITVSLAALLTACSHVATAQRAAISPISQSYVLWSDCPAYTCLFENQQDFGLTTDLYDGLWEGDALPVLPRVAHPSAEIKRWHSGEGTDWLDEEVNATTRGEYPNAQRLWEAEPYPIGNGRIGASVFHGSGRDRYALTDITFWSGGRNGGTINAKGDKSFNGESGPEVTEDGFGGHQPVGDLIVDFCAPAERGSFRRSLHLDEGWVGAEAVRRGVKMESRAFCSHPDQVIAMQYSAGTPHGLSFRLCYATQRPKDTVSFSSYNGNSSSGEGQERTGSLVLTSRLANGMNCVAQADVEVYGGRIAQEDQSLRVVDADSCFIRVAVETNYVMDYRQNWRGSAPEVRITQRQSQLRNDTFSTLLDRHRTDFSSLFSRQSLHLSPSQPDSLNVLPTYARLAHYQQTQQDLGLEETLFNFERYMMISTSRGDAPPGGLQGIWNGMINAPWGNDFHSNINLQMVYWLPEVGNLSECHESLLNYLYATREPNRLATQEYLEAIGDSARGGEDGWIVYTSHNPFGGHGWQVNLPGSAWYALHMWEHFSFGQDTLYLREKTYPMMREISRYWARHLKTLGEGAEGFCSNYQTVDVAEYPELAHIPAGTLVVPAGWSPEHGPRGEDGVAHDQQIVRELFQNTIKAADVLGVDREWADTLHQLCTHLLGPQIGTKGNLMEWMIDRDPVTVHRHTSHLFAVYPGSTISVAATPELAEAARQSLLFRKNEGESRTSWAWTWRSMLWARLHDGARSHEMMEGLITHNMLPNLLTSHKIPQQIDGSYGIAAVMIECLVQSHDDGTIELLPALPPQWQSGGEVRGIRARGGITVSFAWQDGRVTSYSLVSPVPRNVHLIVNGETIECKTEVTSDVLLPLLSTKTNHRKPKNYNNMKALSSRLITLLVLLASAISGWAQNIIDVPTPTAGSDATHLLQDAIDRAALNGGRPTVIRLATAQYNISREAATARLFHVSNTTTVQENPDPTKHIGLHFKGLKNVTFDGNGAKLLTHGEMTTFLLDECENVKLCNFTLDADDPSLAEATVVEVGDGYAVLRTARDTRYEITPEGKLFWTGHGWRFTGGIAQVFNPADNSSLRTASPTDGLLKAAELRPGLLWMQYAKKPNMKVGTTYQMRHSYRTEVCGCISRSKNVTLQDIDFNFLGNFGIVGQFSENLTYDHLRCAPALESDRTGAGFADFVQMSGCKGLVKITNSYFEGAHDDPINVHGTHLKVTEWRGNRQAVVRFMHGQTFGFTPFVKGDDVEIISAHSLLALQSLKVTASEKLNDYEWLLTFNRDVNASAKTEDNVAVENVTWTPSVEVRHNYFGRIPTRGILVSTRRPVVIEDNVFFRMPMASILISDDARSWYESGPAHDVTIRRNKFVECSSPVLFLWPEHDRFEGPVHRNIRVLNNTFSFMNPENPVVVKARAVEGLRVEGNRYETQAPVESLFDLKDCQNVKIDCVE